MIKDSGYNPIVVAGGLFTGIVMVLRFGEVHNRDRQPDPAALYLSSEEEDKDKLLVRRVRSPADSYCGYPDVLQQVLFMHMHMHIYAHGHVHMHESRCCCT